MWISASMAFLSLRLESQLLHWACKTLPDPACGFPGPSLISPLLMLFSMSQPHWPACCSPTHIMCLLLSSGLWYLRFPLLGILPLPSPSLSYLLIDYTYYFKIDIDCSIEPFLTALLTQLWVRRPPNTPRHRFTTTAVPCIIIYGNRLRISSLGSHLFEGEDQALLTAVCPHPESTLWHRKDAQLVFVSSIYQMLTTFQILC